MENARPAGTVVGPFGREMNLRLKINNRVRNVTINRAASRDEISLDGKGIAAEVVEVRTGVFSILIASKVFEARVWAAADGARVAIGGVEYQAQVEDPRQWRRGAAASTGVEGRQKVTAPMPGKVVRILVKSGDKVALGQGLLIVEAMKMQNEIKAAKEGTVEKIIVQEGQPVNAGEILAIIA
jgi:biotin carboxyl carrier protein